MNAVEETGDRSRLAQPISGVELGVSKKIGDGMLGTGSR